MPISWCGRPKVCLTVVMRPGSDSSSRISVASDGRALMKNVVTEHFDLEGVPESEREERWAEVLSSTHVDLAVRVSPDRPRRPFRATVRKLWIDDLALVDAECDPCSGSRGSSRIKNADNEYVVILINRGGRESVAQDDAETEMRPGDAIVWDSNRPVRFRVWEPISKRSLFVPRTALEEVGTRGLGIAGAVLDGALPATELLTGYLDLLARTVDRLSPPAVAAARNATLDLVSAALQPRMAGEASSTSRPALRALVGQWIEKNLEHVDLTPSSIAAAHNLSIRSVHRVFEESGETVGAFVRSRKLARARAELMSTNDPISAIARRWGFCDPSHFARVFREHYGVTPTLYRAEPAAQQAVS
jgi:AraC family transcriptional activator of tynA and feaB